MAKLEYKHGIQSSYYFRKKKHTFKQKIINEILSLGHEIGYHYESLTDQKGNYNKAYQDFNINIEKFRKLCEIKTISMHGAPFSKYDNRDLWKTEKQKLMLVQKYNVLGEIYLDIDYSDILYITDTGRNWQHDIANRRDLVDSNVKLSFASSELLIKYINNQPHNRLVFQTHPERWTNNLLEWQIQYIKDSLINKMKSLINEIT